MHCDTFCLSARITRRLIDDDNYYYGEHFIYVGVANVSNNEFVSFLAFSIVRLHYATYLQLFVSADFLVYPG